MPCPHGCGSPETCSQCRGVVPRRVVRDEATGRLMVDGVPIDRPFIAPSEMRNGPPKGRRRAQPPIRTIDDPDPDPED